MIKNKASRPNIQGESIASSSSEYPKYPDNTDIVISVATPKRKGEEQQQPTNNSYAHGGRCSIMFDLV